MCKSARSNVNTSPCSSGLLLQESNKFSEALHYYKLAIGSRPTLACKYRSSSGSSSSSSFIYNLPPWWLWLCCVQATAGLGLGWRRAVVFNAQHSCMTQISDVANYDSGHDALVSPPPPQPVLLTLCSSFAFFPKLPLWIRHTFLPFLTLNYLQTAASFQTASFPHSDKWLTVFHNHAPN